MSDPPCVRVTVTFVMASVVWKKTVKSCVSHAVTSAVGLCSRILPITHSAVVVTVRIFVNFESELKYKWLVGVTAGI